jgi:hypothetical protein
MCIVEMKEDGEVPLQLGMLWQDKQTKRNGKLVSFIANEHIRDGQTIS